MDGGSGSVRTSKKQSDLTEVFHMGTGFCSLGVKIQMCTLITKMTAMNTPWKWSTMSYDLKLHSAKYLINSSSGSQSVLSYSITYQLLFSDKWGTTISKVIVCVCVCV
jgi:hypothetical protein